MPKIRKTYQYFKMLLRDVHSLAEMSTKHDKCDSETGQRGEELQTRRAAGAAKQTHAHVVQRGARQRTSQQVHRGQWFFIKDYYEFKAKVCNFMQVEGQYSAESLL